MILWWPRTPIYCFYFLSLEFFFILLLIFFLYVYLHYDLCIYVFFYLFFSLSILLFTTYLATWNLYVKYHFLSLSFTSGNELNSDLHLQVLTTSKSKILMSLKFLVFQDVILWKPRNLFVLRLIEMVSVYVWILFLYMNGFYICILKVISVTMLVLTDPT